MDALDKAKERIRAVEASRDFYVKMCGERMEERDEAVQLLTAVTQSDGKVSDLLFNQIQAALKKWGDA